MSETAIADMLNGAMEKTIPMVHGMGVKAVQARRGYASSTVPFEGNGNHFGAMYAGALFTVAEVLGGILAIATFDTEAYYPLVKDLKISFKRPATTAVTAEASLDDAEIGRIVTESAENGKCDFTLETTVTDANGVVVAVTTGVYQLRAHGK